MQNRQKQGACLGALPGRTSDAAPCRARSRDGVLLLHGIDAHFYAAVLLTAEFRIVVGNGRAFAVAYGLYPRSVHTALDKGVLHALGAAFGKLLIVGLGTSAVGVAGHDNGGLRVGGKYLCHTVEFSVEAGTDVRGVDIKGEVALEGEGKRVAFSLNGHGLRIGKRLPHVVFLTVHHVADAGSGKAADDCARRRADERGLGVSADDLAENGACGRAAGRAVGRAPARVALHGAAAAEKQRDYESESADFFHAVFLLFSAFLLRRDGRCHHSSSAGMTRAGAEEAGRLKYLFKNIRDSGKTQMRVLAVNYAHGRTTVVVLLCFCRKISNITM